MSKPADSTGKRTWTGLIIQHLFGLFVCFGIPAAVTAIAPVSWVTFQRTGDHVSARAKVCLLFIVPFRSATIDPVTRVDKRNVAGTLGLTERRSGRRPDLYTKSEDQGFLLIQGPGQEVEVPSTPHNLDAALGKAAAFLIDAKATELKLFMPANWKFSIIAGGFVSLLTVLYVVGLLCTLAKQLLRLMNPRRSDEIITHPTLPHQ